MQYAVRAAQTAVGFSNKGINKSIWHSVAVQFQTLDGKSQMPVSQYLKCKDLTPGQYDGGDMTGAPVIQLPNENALANYTKYFYLEDAWDTVNKKEVEGWANDAGDLVTDEDVVTLGKAFWFRSFQNGGEVNSAGAVINGDTATVTVKPTVWQMIANPFPMPGNLATLITTGLTPGEYDGGDMTGAPQLQIPNENALANYTKYFYLEDAWDTVNKKEVEGWANDAGDLVTSDDKMPLARGAWYKGATGGTLTFVK